MEKEFWRRITRDEIVADYNTKAVNVDTYQRKDNIVTQQEKVKNETRQQMINLFHYLFATDSFHFRTGQAKLSQGHFSSIRFLKVRRFPGKIGNKSLPGVFLEASLPLQ